MDFAISKAAQAAFPLAEAGHTMQPFAGVIYVLAGLVCAVAIIMYLASPDVSLGATVLKIVVPFSFSLLNMLVVTQYHKAQIFDAEPTLLPALIGVNENGGGLFRPTRTQLQFKDGTSFTVRGSLRGWAPGQVASKKSVENTTYVCRGEGNTTDCLPVN